VTLIAERPAPGRPRPYAFPRFVRHRLDNGLELLVVDLPQRELVSASLIIRSGAVDEPDDQAGLTVLMSRGLTEGTQRHDAIELIEATERLGASIHAESGWDAFSVNVDVPAGRLGPALELLAEVTSEPTFPDEEIERLRDERLNDLLQARADPRRRAEEAYIETLYASSSPYRRPSGGTAGTVERLDADACRGLHRRLFDPAAMTLIVGGDLSGLDPVALASEHLGSWTATDPAASASSLGEGGRQGKVERIDDSAASTQRRVRVIDRPGSVQTEIRVGHVGLPRKIDDFHALSVMGAILGGLFDSRLNRKLREEKGYTYGASAGYELRRGRGPFAARAAVNTEVTVPAVVDLVAELEGMRTRPIAEDELAAGRDFLVGVFPLRFETSGAVVSALAGLVIHDLPDDELTRYRPAIAAVTADDVLAAARSHVRPDEAAIVLVGAADGFLPALESAGLGPITVDREPTTGDPGAA